MFPPVSQGVGISSNPTGGTPEITPSHCTPAGVRRLASPAYLSDYSRTAIAKSFTRLEMALRRCSMASSRARLTSPEHCTQAS